MQQLSLVGVVLLVALVGLPYGIYEISRYNAMYELCSNDYDIHVSFKQESVCNNTMTTVYELAGLTNCKKAEKKIVEETPRPCAIRNWYFNSWIYQVVTKIIHVWDKATSSVMIVVMFICIVLIVWIWRHEAETTLRHALSLETQNLTVDVMRNLMPKSPPPKLMKRTRSASRLVVTNGEAPS